MKIWDYKKYMVVLVLLIAAGVGSIYGMRSDLVTSWLEKRAQRIKHDKYAKICAEMAEYYDQADMIIDFSSLCLGNKPIAQDVRLTMKFFRSDDDTLVWDGGNFGFALKLPVQDEMKTGPLQYEVFFSADDIRLGLNWGILYFKKQGDTYTIFKNFTRYPCVPAILFVKAACQKVKTLEERRDRIYSRVMATISPSEYNAAGVNVALEYARDVIRTKGRFEREDCERVEWLRWARESDDWESGAKENRYVIASIYDQGASGNNAWLTTYSVVFKNDVTQLIYEYSGTDVSPVTIVIEEYDIRGNLISKNGDFKLQEFE